MIDRGFDQKWFDLSFLIEKRKNQFKKIDGQKFDLAIAGGGATGAGVALEAQARGLKSFLFDCQDFGEGTSSRSTKLIHGGLRYLAQGNIKLVFEALRERKKLLDIANASVHPISFIIPCRTWFESLKMKAGVTAYKSLSMDFGQSWEQQPALKHFSNLERNQFASHVHFWDGQFDDCRLLMDSLLQAERMGGSVFNHCSLKSVSTSENGIHLKLQDLITSISFEINCSTFVNATGVFSKEVQDQVGSALHIEKSTLPLAYSRGSHIVVGRQHWPEKEAMLIPETSDGRVLFVIPWLNYVLIGTTDVPCETPSFNPQPSHEEIDYLLDTVNAYLKNNLSKTDIKASFAGIRPLVQSSKKHTKELSREHEFFWHSNDFVTAIGGKWTTFRLMGEELVKEFLQREGRSASRQDYTIGNQGDDLWVQKEKSLDALQTVFKGIDPLFVSEDRSLSVAEAFYFVLKENAWSADDLFSRRSRLGFLDETACQKAQQRFQKILDSLSQDTIEKLQSIPK